MLVFVVEWVFLFGLYYGGGGVVGVGVGDFLLVFGWVHFDLMGCCLGYLMDVGVVVDYVCLIGDL